MVLSWRSIQIKTHTFTDKAVKFIVRWRLAAIIIIVVFITAFELIEHLDSLISNLSYFSVELGSYFTFIIMIAFLVEIAINAAYVKNRTIQILDARHNLSVLLAAAKDWQEVVKHVLQYPHSIIPVSATSLLIYDPASDHFLSESEWVAPNEKITLPNHSVSKATYCLDDLKEIAPNIHMDDCERIAVISEEKHRCYHVILNYGNIPVGIMLIVLQPNSDIDASQALLLSKTAEDIAIGLHAAKQRKEQQAIEVANAASNERLEIARDLHDTLGQNLGYLHLKLDQILSESKDLSCQVKQSELERLRELANESYELVRNTLVILYPKSSHRISELFNAHIRIIAKRAGFSMTLDETGIPRSIQARYIKQVLHAFKESLYNIEKHSGARQVNVHLIWSESLLIIRVQDDGSGFEVTDATEFGHYGLHIIEERVRSMGGKVEINSTLGQGTEVVFWIPVLRQEKEPINIIQGEI